MSGGNSPCVRTIVTGVNVNKRPVWLSIFNGNGLPKTYRLEMNSGLKKGPCCGDYHHGRAVRITIVYSKEVVHGKRAKQ